MRKNRRVEAAAAARVPSRQGDVHRWLGTRRAALHAPAPAQGHHGSCGNLPVEDDGAGTAHEAAGLADDEDENGGGAATAAVVST